ncbi:MAG: Gfo/Idh/MocA family oxidoreductase [Ignavibacteriales bacterium]|nr:Gfo/Idh/MocA family oxidoreductase [Ignavibacteriales bacterium]
MNTMRVGVIGVGHLGTFHAQQYKHVEGAMLVGVFDVDRTKAAAVASETGVRAYDSAEQLLADVDAVSVATATQSHFEVAKEALQRGKHVLVEKPLTATIPEARELVTLARLKKRKLQVGHIERFNAAILALEKYRLRPLFIESHRLAQFNPRGADVAVVLDLMIHDIDLILSLVKSPVERIDANGVAVVSSSVDIANARLQFQNGCVANVTASRISQNKMRKMRMFQQDAYISLDFAQGLAEVFRLLDEHDPSVQATMLLGKIDQGERKRVIVYEQPEVKEVNSLRHELELFVSSVRDDVDPPVTGEDGLQALEVAEEIMRKIESQRITVG